MMERYPKSSSKGKSIQIPDSNESSEDDYSSKIWILKLNCHNWLDWRNWLKNALIGKGHEEILDPEWIARNKSTKTYRKKNALTINILYQSVNKELLPWVKESQNNFNLALDALAKACGEKLVIVICNLLAHLVNLTYKPQSSLQEHTSNFKDAYVTLSKNMNAQTHHDRIMEVSTGMAAAL